MLSGFKTKLYLVLSGSQNLLIMAKKPWLWPFYLQNVLKMDFEIFSPYFSNLEAFYAKLIIFRRRNKFWTFYNFTKNFRESGLASPTKCTSPSPAKSSRVQRVRTPDPLSLLTASWLMCRKCIASMSTGTFEYDGYKDPQKCIEN